MSCFVACIILSQLNAPGRQKQMIVCDTYYDHHHTHYGLWLFMSL